MVWPKPCWPKPFGDRGSHLHISFMITGPRITSLHVNMAYMSALQPHGTAWTPADSCSQRLLPAARALALRHGGQEGRLGHVPRRDARVCAGLQRAAAHTSAGRPRRPPGSGGAAARARRPLDAPARHTARSDAHARPQASPRLRHAGPCPVASPGMAPALRRAAQERTTAHQPAAHQSAGKSSSAAWYAPPPAPPARRRRRQFRNPNPPSKYSARRCQADAPARLPRAGQRGGEDEEAQRRQRAHGARRAADRLALRPRGRRRRGRRLRLRRLAAVGARWRRRRRVRRNPDHAIAAHDDVHACAGRGPHACHTYAPTMTRLGHTCDQSCRVNCPASTFSAGAVAAYLQMRACAERQSDLAVARQTARAGCWHCMLVTHLCLAAY